MRCRNVEFSNISSGLLQEILRLKCAVPTANCSLGTLPGNNFGLTSGHNLSIDLGPRASGNMMHQMKVDAMLNSFNVHVSENNDSLVVHLCGEDNATREQKISMMLFRGYYNFSSLSSRLRRGMMDQLLLSMDEPARVALAKQILMDSAVTTPAAEAAASLASLAVKRKHTKHDSTTSSLTKDGDAFTSACWQSKRDCIQSAPNLSSPSGSQSLRSATTRFDHAPETTTEATTTTTLNGTLPLVRTREESESHMDEFNATSEGESARKRRNDAGTSITCIAESPTCPKCKKKITVRNRRPYNHKKQNGSFYFIYQCCGTDYSNMSVLSGINNKQFKKLTPAVSTLSEWHYLRYPDGKGKWRITCRGRRWTRCEHCKALYKNTKGKKSYHTRDRCPWSHLDPDEAGKAAAITVT